VTRRARPAPSPPARDLEAPVATLRGVGERRARELARAGITTIGDLLVRLPFRYEDRATLTPIGTLRPGAPASAGGEVVRCALRRTRRPGFTIFEALIRDATGMTTAVWFNQRYLRDVFAPGLRVVLYGPVEPRGMSGVQFTNPHYEFVGAEGEDGGIHTGRIVPVYERIGALTPKLQRVLVHGALETLESGADPLPVAIRDRLGFPSREAALRDVHFPPAGSDVAALNARATPAQRRLIFEEFFEFQLGIALRRRASDAEAKPFRIAVDDRIRDLARRMLPFRLTDGQKSALREIVADQQRAQPMNRLLQGDVGAGKTVVAALAALVALENGLQVAVMAPTSLLAEQHGRTLAQLLAPTSHPVDVLTGSTPAAQRRAIAAAAGAGQARLVVGTHALVEEDVVFARLGLAVVDEQHRFGVVHRARLRAKGQNPDVLVMTATPIPRTLALTTYGDLDVSTIRQRLPGRTAVRTTVRPEERRPEVYEFVREELGQGRQAYVVYPLVEDSAKVDLRAATAMADHLAAEVFPEHRVALLHGRMTAEAKQRVMAAFLRKEVQVLVATTVIEVGLDVANATVMVVEHAERFGLAQLHQLRGRVGRGTAVSSCILLYQAPLTDDARARLQAIAATDDGFVLAEKDLELRGPGDVFGTRQSGMPHLRVGDLVRDRATMEVARAEARAWLAAHGEGDPAVAHVARTWAGRFGLGEVG
jgi:ATP-dependent DNA helicase RecG